jgi:hypothetical protein
MLLFKDYNSHNTARLDIEEIKKLLLKLDDITKELQDRSLYEGF